jgi:hypothetical protein
MIAIYFHAARQHLEEAESALWNMLEQMTARVVPNLTLFRECQDRLLNAITEIDAISKRVNPIEDRLLVTYINHRMQAITSLNALVNNALNDNKDFLETAAMINALAEGFTDDTTP